MRGGSLGVRGALMLRRAAVGRAAMRTLFRCTCSSWGLGVALLVHVVASLRARQLRSSGENGVQVVDAIVDQLLCCVIAALSGARDSDEAMTRAPLQGTPCCEPPGPFTSGIPPGKGSFLSMCGWPAVSFTPSRCARAHATVLLLGQAGGHLCR